MRVLLVEDDPATAQGIEMMMRSESYVCDVTDMGEDGLEIGKLYDYDIIVLDLMLPDWTATRCYASCARPVSRPQSLSSQG